MISKQKLLILGGMLLPLLAAVFVYSGNPVFAAQSHGYIVKLKTADPSGLEALGVTSEPQFGFSSEPQFQNIFHVTTELDLSTLQQKLAGQAEYVEVDAELTAGQNEVTKVPNDPGYSTNKANIDKQWGLPKAMFPKAWRKTTGSVDVVVAVIDTGIDASHEDFEDTAFMTGYDFVNEKAIRPSSNSDDNGHGTLVAGVIAATMNNKKGITGASPNVSLMAVKALNSRGSGSASRISQGIVWAADNGADVINMSLGGIGFAHDSTLANAISYAFQKNVVILSAAGNDVAITGGNLDKEPVFPICNDNDQNMVIGVTASDVNDLKPDFANFGKACVDVTAPGRRILSTINYDPATGQFAPDSYAYASGTSLAVPFVSAQAALLRTLYPTASNRQIRDRIIATADQIDRLNLVQCGGKSCSGYLGSGRINVAASLEKKLDGITDGDVVSIIEGKNELYLINGGRRQRISAFVQSQRFGGVTPKSVYFSEIESYPEGTYATPVDGTLVKAQNSPTVYYISGGLRLPVTGPVFKLKQFAFQNVFTLNNTEVNSWVVGSFLAPPDGTLVRTPENPTVYWVVGDILHPINAEFYKQRGLNVFPVLYMPAADLNGFPKGESLIL